MTVRSNSQGRSARANVTPHELSIQRDSAASETSRDLSLPTRTCSFNASNKRDARLCRNVGKSA